MKIDAPEEGMWSWTGTVTAPVCVDVRHDRSVATSATSLVGELEVHGQGSGQTTNQPLKLQKRALDTTTAEIESTELLSDTKTGSCLFGSLQRSKYGDRTKRLHSAQRIIAFHSVLKFHPPQKMIKCRLVQPGLHLMRECSSQMHRRHVFLKIDGKFCTWTTNNMTTKINNPP